jgi:DNA polymerase V
MTSQDAHLSSVPAGFPSPADDYKANKLDLDDLVIHNPQATYYVRVRGNSMKNAGIADGDIVVVDRSLDATHNAIIVAILNGRFTLKRLYDKDGARYLVPANRLYKPIKVTQGMEFQVWGVVTYCIHRVK